MKNTKIKILIADDHALMRVGIRSMLESNTDLTVVGESCDGEAAVAMAQQLRPDVIIMDLMMPKMNGGAATEKILSLLPKTRVIVLTSFGTSSEMAKALHAGAVGALLKESPSEELISAIHAVMAGKTAIHPEVLSYLQSAKEQPELTPRQLDILKSVASGSPDKLIAEQHQISIPGVRKHLNAIMTKLGATSRTEAVAIALRKHLLKI